jgi:hypothetical protein
VTSTPTRRAFCGPSRPSYAYDEPPGGRIHRTLNSAIEEAAEYSGKLDQYRQAMEEYHNAMRRRALGQGLKDVATSTGGKAASATETGAVGAHTVKSSSNP